MEPTGRFEGRGEFQDAIRTALAEAAAAGWRELWLCDPDFENWPLGERSVIESLTHWAGAQRRLTLLALHFDEVSRRHARWAQWRRQWSHVAHCRALQELQPDDVPVMLYAPGALVIRLLDPRHCRGIASGLAADGLQAGELIDAISQRSVEAFPATALGL